MPKSNAEQLYDEHHAEFEMWFSNMHPNHNLTFDWKSVFDSGWYNEPMTQGAWITWLDLTGKNTLPSASDDIDSIVKEVTCLNEAVLNLTARANAVLISEQVAHKIRCDAPVTNNMGCMIDSAKLVAIHNITF